MRLFRTLARIAVRMSATISCLTPQRSSFFRAPATPGPALFFSTLMSDEAKTIARGLQKRDPDLLDRLIEQYQYRLFRYLVYVTGNKERAEDFFQERGFAFSSAATSTTENQNSKPGSSPSRGT